MSEDRENTESVADCLRPSKDEVESVGDFHIRKDDQGHYFCRMILPGGAGVELQIQIGSHSPSPVIWGWNGDLAKPTLCPSIWCKGRWHGYLTDGQFLSC